MGLPWGDWTEGDQGRNRKPEGRPLHWSEGLWLRREGANGEKGVESPCVQRESEQDLIMD